MAEIGTLAPTTELDAVNTMLAAIGEARLTDLSTASGADVLLAIDLLRRSAVEVQSAGWQYNAEFGYEISSTGTFSWTGTDGATETINIFTVPTTPPLLAFQVTEGKDQVGYSKPDVAVRLSRQFTSGEPTAPVMVFYDRTRNRDGFVNKTKLYIDPIWLLQWSELPEAAKRYIIVRAGRQFIQQTVGSTELAGFAQQDEAYAYRVLKRDYGLVDNYNMLEDAGVGSILSFKGSRFGGLYDPRPSAGPA